MQLKRSLRVICLKHEVLTFAEFQLLKYERPREFSTPRVHFVAAAGELVDAHPSNYESVAGGLPEIRKIVEGLQRKFNEESKVRTSAGG